MKPLSRARWWILFLAICLVLGSPRVGAGPERPWTSWLGETDSYYEGPDLVFAWRTVNETGLIGFDVDQLQANKTWKRITADMVVAVQSDRGAWYEVRLYTTDRVYPCIWRIVAWDNDLQRHHSPPLVGRIPSRQAPIDHHASAASESVQPGGSSDGERAIDRPPRLGASSNGQRLRCATRDTGWHRIGAGDIAQCLGVPVSSIRECLQQRKLCLTHRGEAVAYFVERDGTAMVFWAEPYKNNFTDWNVYWLIPGDGLPAASLDGGTPIVPGTEVCRARAEVEEDLIPRYDLSTDPDEDYWFWQRLVGSHPVVGQTTVGFHIDALASDPTPALFRLRFKGGTTAEHHAAVAVNGCTNIDWQTTWTGKVSHEFQIQVPSDCLREGTNHIKLTALGTTKSQWYFDGFSLEYTRPCRAVHDTFALACLEAAPISIRGFSTPALHVWDITLPSRPVLLTNVVIDQSDGSYRVSFAPPTVPGYYSAFADGAPMPQPALESRDWIGLAQPGNRADLVIIAPRFLSSAAEPLAAHRRHQGLDVMTVTLESVYDEFNDGLSEPESIRRFLRQARSVWAKPPAYVLLAGNGTYDYRNLQGRNDNLLPPLMVPTPFGLFASDSAFGDLEGGPAPELAVGRLPACTPEALGKVVEKILRYETDTPQKERRALLVADSPDGAGNFVQDILTVREMLGSAYRAVLAYPDAVSDVRQEFLASLRAGVDLVCFMGHGAVDRLGANGYLLSSDVAELANGTRLPLLLAMTCLAGQFSVPGYDCLAEQLVLSPGEGAVAVVSPTGLSFNHEASELNLWLIEGLQRGDLVRLGDYVREAMVRYNQGGPRATPSAIYGIIGDPSTPYSANRALPPSLLIKSTENQTVLLSLVGARGQAYRIWATDAVPVATGWQWVTNVLVGSEPVLFRQPSPFSVRQTFYRAESYP